MTDESENNKDSDLNKAYWNLYHIKRCGGIYSCSSCGNMLDDAMDLIHKHLPTKEENESETSILLAGDTCDICGKLLSTDDYWERVKTDTTGERKVRHKSCETATN